MRRPRRPRRASGLLAALATLAALLAAEGWLRRSRPAPTTETPANLEYAYIEPSRPFFAPVDKRDGAVVYRTRRPGAPVAEFAMPKPAGTLRVFAVGGSVALPFGASNFQAAAATWRSFAASSRIELISAGVGGYDSERDLGSLRAALELSPDLVVVMSGNNENFLVDIPNPRLLALNLFLRRSALVRVAQDRFASWRPKRPRSLESVESRFEANLLAMVAEARKAGVPLILCTLPANLRANAPVQGERNLRHPDWRDEGFVAGLKAFESGNARLALGRWRRYAAERPRDPFGAWYVARALDAVGERAEAIRWYRLSGDLTAPPDIRCRPARNETIRRVAAREGVALVDLEKLFGDLEGSVPGAAVMHDPCHWHHQYYTLVMTRLLLAARPLLGGRLALDDAWLARKETALRHPEIAPLRRELYAAMALKSAFYYALTSYPPEKEGLLISEYVVSQLDLGRRLSPELWRRTASRPEDAPRLLADASGAFPLAPAMFDGKWPLIWAHVGELERRLGRRREAIALFDRVLAEIPDFDDVKRLRRLAEEDLASGRGAERRTHG